MTNPIPAPYAGRYALSVFCVFGFETAIELRSSMAAIILTIFFDDKLRANCLPIETIVTGATITMEPTHWQAGC